MGIFISWEIASKVFQGTQSLHWKFEDEDAEEEVRWYAPHPGRI